MHRTTPGGAVAKVQVFSRVLREKSRARRGRPRNSVGVCPAFGRPRDPQKALFLQGQRKTASPFGIRRATRAGEILRKLCHFRPQAPGVRGPKVGGFEFYFWPPRGSMVWFVNLSMPNFHEPTSVGQEKIRTQASWGESKTVRKFGVGTPPKLGVSPNGA